MNQILINLFLKALCSILCQFCECCKDDESCPDGVCGPLEDAVAELEGGSISVAASNVAAPKFEIDWSELQLTIEALTAAVRQLIKFLGLSARVGG